MDLQAPLLRTNLHRPPVTADLVHRERLNQGVPPQNLVEGAIVDVSGLRDKLAASLDGLFFLDMGHSQTRAYALGKCLLTQHPYVSEFR